MRKQCYRSVFAGGCGVTYGHHSIWQFYAPGREPITHPDRSWMEALDRPGAGQMIHLRALMESRPFLTRAPDRGLLASDAGAGGAHVEATSDAEGSYALVYLPGVQTVSVHLGTLAGTATKAWWYDPRSGGATAIGVYPNAGTRSFTPPDEGPDWVLVLDDATRDFGPPGTHR